MRLKGISHNVTHDLKLNREFLRLVMPIAKLRTPFIGRPPDPVVNERLKLPLQYFRPLLERLREITQSRRGMMESRRVGLGA